MIKELSPIEKLMSMITLKDKVIYRIVNDTSITLQLIGRYPNTISLLSREGDTELRYYTGGSSKSKSYVVIGRLNKSVSKLSEDDYNYLLDKLNSKIKSYIKK